MGRGVGYKGGRCGRGCESRGPQYSAHIFLQGEQQVLPAASPSGPSSVSGGTHSLPFLPRGGSKVEGGTQDSSGSECCVPTQWLCPQVPGPWSIQLPQPLKRPKLGLVFPAGKGAGATGRDPWVGELHTLPSLKGPQDTPGSASLNYDFEEGLY